MLLTLKLCWYIFQKTAADEEFLFLDHQLDLFGKLCYVSLPRDVILSWCLDSILIGCNLQGRNEFAINVITEELGYLTWEEAFQCLSNEDLPDQLRAKYCSLIIGAFRSSTSTQPLCVVTSSCLFWQLSSSTLARTRRCWTRSSWRSCTTMSVSSTAWQTTKWWVAISASSLDSIVNIHVEPLSCSLNSILVPLSCFQSMVCIKELILNYLRCRFFY